jgi:hypothetical protein
MAMFVILALLVQVHASEGILAAVNDFSSDPGPHNYGVLLYFQFW